MPTMLEKSLRFFVLGAIFSLTLIPFIVAETFFFPYITGKNFAFRIIVEIMAGAWIVLALLNPSYRPRRSWVLTAFTVFVLVIALSNALGAYPFKSFWSNYERMDGWVTLAHLLTYIFVAASTIASEGLWRRLFQTSLGLSACVSIYGFLQVIGVVGIGNGVVAGLTARIDGTFGNPIYLAAFMLFQVFIAALLIAQSGKKEWNSIERTTVALFALIVTAIFAGILKKAEVGWHPYAALVAWDAIVMWLMFFRQTYVLSFVLILNVATLLLTSTRGTILGLLGGSVLAALLVAFFERPRAGIRSSSVPWRVAVGYLVCIVIAAGVFFAARSSPFMQQIGFLGRLSTISLQENGTKARLINWSTAWEGVKERPVLGWGQENFALVFDKYYDPRMYAQEPWFDRVHNIIFDWLVAGGFVGLLSYLSIFAAALAALWSRAFTRVEASILTGLLAGYFFHNFFVFDNVTSYMLFGMVIAYIAWRSSAHTNEPPLWRKNIPQSAVWIVAVGVVAVTWTLVYWANMGAIAQNKALIQAIIPQQGGAAKNLEIMNSSIAYGTFGTQEAREQLTQLAARVANSPEVDPIQKKAFYEAAVAEMTQQERESPLDARFPLFIGIVHNSFGNYAAGAEALRRALKNSPGKQSILYEIANNAQARGDIPAALAALKEAHEVEPANSKARILYATVLIQTGRSAEADPILAPIIPTGEAADRSILSAYLAGKQYNKIAVVWEGKVKASPEDSQAYFTLAAAYYGSGDTTKAISTLEAASKISPEVAAQAAQFIQQVKNGTVQI